MLSLDRYYAPLISEKPLILLGDPWEEPCSAPVGASLVCRTSAKLHEHQAPLGRRVVSLKLRQCSQHLINVGTVDACITTIRHQQPADHVGPRLRAFWLEANLHSLAAYHENPVNQSHGADQGVNQSSGSPTFLRPAWYLRDLKDAQCEAR